MVLEKLTITCKDMNSDPYTKTNLKLIIELNEKPKLMKHLECRRTPLCSGIRQKCLSFNSKNETKQNTKQKN